MEYQWYPGHMAKAKKQMQEDLKLIDLIIELTDARVPDSGRNPDLQTMGASKSRLILLNKADLADPALNARWVEHYKREGYAAAAIDARTRNKIGKVQDAITKACKKKRERDARRGIQNRPVRAMVVGIPNVGKSTFINTFAGKAAAKTGNKPGVTKGKQWIRLNKDVQLLDTPGILWPKFADQTTGLHLALIGSMNDQILDTDELAIQLLQILQKQYPACCETYYGIAPDADPVKLLHSIAKVRNCIKKGGEVDYSKAAALLLDDFRAGRLGRITLEEPEDPGCRTAKDAQQTKRSAEWRNDQKSRRDK